METRRDHAPEDLRVLKWGWIPMGSVVHRNVDFRFPPEYTLCPNGDLFVPILLARFGAAKYQTNVGPFAYRQRPGSMWSSRTREEQNVMNLRSYLQIASYFLRIGEHTSAKEIVRRQLGRNATEYVL
jgi:hypothetical protein